ncbi:hypothetical protein F2Q68_00019241 [Brassica cretica]|uniref:F-box domain-containing protein n=1 Tax=Brassica cretica TaxID=69181 RepID=A0A8S9FUR5_BRACR|nr:hypothetical protein F2Q68_00019241 [Brassica cretica]
MAATPASLLPEAFTMKPIVQAPCCRCSVKARENHGSKNKCTKGLWDLNIPSELLEEILSRLGLKDNIKASAVCKAWCEAAASVRKTRRRSTYHLEALDETNPLTQTVRRSDLRRALTRRNNTQRRLGVPDPRQPQFPVRITASLSSQSTSSRPDRKKTARVRVAARVRGSSVHLGGLVSTICKTKVILILRT